MKILLPPSETKREGGRGAPLDVASLSLPALTSRRLAVLDALTALAEDEEAAQRVLKLSPRQRGDIAHNRNLRAAPTVPAVDRYTGVLYDALDAETLSAASRRWLGSHVWIHSAPLGPIGALDGLPTYRLAAGTSLPGVAPLRRHWAAATTAAIDEEAPSFVLDLRSEAYVALGNIPATVPSAYVKVVTEHGRALNHFNKKSKGLLVRALADDRPRIDSLRQFRGWAQRHNLLFREGDTPGVLEFVVEG